MDRRRPAGHLPLRLALALLALAAACRRDASPSLRVAIAPESAPAFEALGAEFTHAESVSVAWRAGEPDAVSRQMLDPGAPPYDLLIATDPALVGRLVSQHRCDDASRSFAGFATLVLITAPRAPRADTLQAIADPRYARVAILDPERSPYGRAARQALTMLGIEQSVAPRLTLAATTRQAIDLVRSGGAQAAIVPRVAVTEGDSLAVPPDLHRPIEQLAVVCARESARRDAAMRLLTYIREGDGRRLLEAYGYVFP